MGLWGKIKGVFGRIANGIKHGYNWVKDHITGIKDVANKVVNVLPDNYKDPARTITDNAFNTFDKIRGVIG